MGVSALLGDAFPGTVDVASAEAAAFCGIPDLNGGDEQKIDLRMILEMIAASAHTNSESAVSLMTFLCMFVACRSVEDARAALEKAFARGFV